MCHSNALRLFIICFVSGAVSVCFFVYFAPAQETKQSSVEQPVYHADPQHLWNRCYAALFIRVGPDGRVYGKDRLEPLLWPWSKHLLEERSHQRAMAVLKELLDENGEKLIENPVKQAMLQRDLWMVFNWVEGDHRSFEKPPLTPEAARGSQQRLRRPLAEVIRRLALSPREIRDLPDNYAAAVSSGRFTKRFDPNHPDKPFLPPDLFVADGPWVCVGRSDGVTAPQHLREDGTNRFTNSVFLVFLHLPDGRAATAEFLKYLRSFDQPLLVRNPDNRDRQRFVPNPKLRQFPKGTQVALVRRAMLIDSTHRVVATPLTESVQLRVMHGVVPAFTARTRTPRDNSWQSFHEIRLSRSGLFAGEAGGLRAAGPDERDFKTGFNCHPLDEFERPLRPDQSFLKMSQPVAIRKRCFACHSLPGVYSFNSFQNFRNGLIRGGDEFRPFPISETPVSDVADAAIKWKEGRPSWTTLRSLLVD